MSSFDDIAAQAALVWFDTDIMAAAVSLNGATVAALILDRGTERDENSVFDYLDVELQAGDYAAMDYRNDALVYGGITWRWPEVKTRDGVSVSMRWIANQQPRIRR